MEPEQPIFGQSLSPVSKSPLLVICGPTAAGKSALALAICQRLGGELVSADSVQVYRGLDIGSAKPSTADQAAVRHHLVDICDPATARLDAQAWADRADAAIDDIASRGLLAVVCGGTGLYLRALLNGLSVMPDVPEAIKAQVREAIAARGAPALHAELQAVDPVSAARLAPGDAQRVGRALEVYRASGRPLSAWQTTTPGAVNPRYPAAKVFGLWPARELLDQRITERAQAMLDAGLLDEVSGLMASGVPHDTGPLMALGYRQVVAWLLGGGDSDDLAGLAELAVVIGRAHRKYSKRQLTWFKGVGTRDHGLVHIETQDEGAVEQVWSAVRTGSR